MISKTKIMKTKILYFFLAAMLPAFAFAQSAQLKIGYTNMDYILTQLPEYKTIESEISSYQKQLESQLNSKYQEYQDKLDDYQQKIQAGTLTTQDRQTREQELTDLQQSIQKFQSDADTSLQKKTAELLQPAYDKIMKAVHDVAVDKGYTHVFSNAAGNVPILLYGDDQYDVTDDVLRKLGVTPTTPVTQKK
jgi:outer membrane protein